MLEIIVIIICLFFSAFFSGSEHALSSANKLRIKKKAEEGNKNAKVAMFLNENYSKTISTILLGNNLVNILASSMTTVLAVRIANGENEATVTSIATIIVTIVILIFGEILPKILASEHSNKLVYVIAKPLRFLQKFFFPVVFVVTKLIDKVSVIWTPKEIEESVTDEELVDMVETIEDSGQFDEDKSELIKSAIEFSDIEAYEIMVPRVDVIGIDIDDESNDILEDLSIFNHSVVPVYEENIDNIIGFIKTKDLMRQYLITNELNIDALLKKPTFVHKTKSILDILEEFKETGDTMAVIKDEFGGTMGIITIEDILEELVGDIWDEKDKVTLDYIEKEDGTLEVDGMMNIFDFFESVEYDAKDFESAYTTVGGWCTEMLEDFPEVGETFEFENMIFEILATDEFRVERVKVSFIEKEEDDED